MSSNCSDLPLILSGQFFKIVQNEGDPEGAHMKTTVAKCMLCPKQSLISSSKTSTGNFYRHLRVSSEVLNYITI